MAVAKAVFFLGLILLFHAGYSSVQRELLVYYKIMHSLYSFHNFFILLFGYTDKSFLKLAEEEYEGLPSDVCML